MTVLCVREVKALTDLCVRAAKALTRLPGCAGLLEPLLLPYSIGVAVITHLCTCIILIVQIQGKSLISSILEAFISHII